MKNSLKEFIRRYFTIIFVSFTLIISLPLALWIRFYFIEKEKNLIYNNIQQSVIQINNILESNYQKMYFLSEIILSQLNNPRAFYDINATFKTVLSSEISINKVFVVIAKGNNIFDSEINTTDSLGNLNITWTKSIENIVYLDSLNFEENLNYFEKIKNNPTIWISEVKVNNQIKNVNISKIVVFPLFEGNAFVGVFGFEINSNYFEPILIKNNISQNSFIIDEYGKNLYNQGKLNYLGQAFTFITNENFKNFEQNIVQQQSFFAEQKQKILIFTSFNTYFGNKWSMGVFISKKDIYRTANIYFVLILSILGILILALTTLYYNLIEKSTSQIQKLMSFIENISKGRINDKVSLETKIDDFKQIEVLLENIRQRFVNLNLIHEQIKNQKEKQHLEPFDENDIVAKGINEAVDAITVRQKNRLEASEIQKRNEWISEGLNNLHEASRVTDFNNLNELIDNINKTLTIYSNAFLTTFYISEIKDNRTVLQAISTFGIQEKYAFYKEIELGEGIVGTVALERKRQYYKVIPENYRTIITGLGEMKPVSILLQPLEYENEFYGIIEIAFLRYLEDYEIEFFEKASSEIALSIKNIITNIAKEKLVEQLRNQTKEIEQAQKLLQEKVKELQSKEKEATEREAIMRSTFNAINNTLITIEYTTKGILLNANEKYLKITGYTLDEIRGVNVLDLVKSERQELEDIIRRVSQGESVEKLVKRFTKFGEERWFYSTYTPYYDTNGNITKIIYFAFDLTETKKHITKLEKEISLLRKQVKILREKI